MRQRWADDRFTGHCLAQRSLMRFWSKVRRQACGGAPRNRRVVLIMGAARFPASGRGPTAPTVASVQAAICVFGWTNVRFQDEHRTSKTHADCGHVLQDVEAVVAVRRRQRNRPRGHHLGHGRAREYLPGEVVKVRGLRRCVNGRCRGCLVDRDINAAINIRMNFLYGLRRYNLLGGDLSLPHLRHRPRDEQAAIDAPDLRPVCRIREHAGP